MAKARYQTLAQIGMRWVVTMEMLGTGIFCISLVLAFSLPLFGYSYHPEIIGAGAILMFIVGIVHHVVFYDFVKCPVCNGKLNKFKNGKNVPIKQAHTQLDNNYGCRHCGWKPIPIDA